MALQLQYVVLNRNCLRDVREHEEPHQLQLRTVQSTERRPWLDEQLAKIKASNAQSRHPRVTSQIDTALRILHGMQTIVQPEDPEAFLKKQVVLPYHKDPNRAPHPRDLVAKVHSVLAAIRHSKYRKAVATTNIYVPHAQLLLPNVMHELKAATWHACQAAKMGFFSRTVAMVGIDFRDVAAWHGIDVGQDPRARFDALLCAVTEYQLRAYFEELGNMLDDPEAGYGSPLCAMSTCISYSRMRTPREYPNLVRCTDGCSDAVHATYCSVPCREKDVVRHKTAAKGVFKLDPPICLRDAEAGRALQGMMVLL